MTMIKSCKRYLSRHKEKKKLREYEPASFKELMRYAEKLDYILLMAGIIASIISGALFPVTCSIMQQIHNTMIRTQGVLNIYTDNSTIDTGVRKTALDILVDNVSQSCLFMAFNGTGMLIFGYISMMSFYYLCERQIHRIRKVFLQKVLKQDMEWFDYNESGAISHKMTSGIEKIKDGFSDKIGVFILALSNLFIGVGYALYLHWKLALMMIAVAPLIILSLALSSMAMISASKKEAKNYSIAGSLAEEIISGIKTVIAFNGQMFEYDRYNKVLRKAQKIGIKKAVITGFFSGLYMAVLFGSIGLAFWYGTQLVFSKEIQPGTVLTVFWAVFLGALKVGYALPNLGIISNAKLAAGEIFSIIDRESYMDDDTKKKQKLDKFEGKIEFRGVHFAYPLRYDHKILNGISFTVEPGQHIAFVGQSGCGKSTVFSLLSKFYHHNQGQIKIDDTVIEEIDENWLRSVIGVVSQGPVLFTDTVIENLKMGNPAASIEEIIKACKMANAHEFIEKLPNSYDTVIGEGGVVLSGGQKQRIAIARALIKNPKILLLDEATSALDTESEAAVQEALDHASEGRTTITIAHRLSTVKKADCIYVFEKGYIVEGGTHQELLQMKNHYWDLVKDQEIKGAEKHIPNDDIIENELMEVKRKKSENYNRKLSKAMSHVRGYWEVTNEDEENNDHEDEKPPLASIAAIFRFCKPELKYAFAGIFLSFLRGFQWPTFAILLGEFFKVLSMHDPMEAIQKSHLIAYIFLGVGIIGGLATFGSGCLLGTSGEKMAARLRLAVFRNILRQDGYYFDKSNHSVGRLTARLASDANNVQAAIDQRLSEVLQGITSLCAGVIYAIWISPVVAPVCIISAVVLAVTQIIIINYLKKRGIKDCKSADNASKIANEAISNVKTIQSLVHQDATYKKFCAASHEPHKRAVIRGFFQSFNYSLGLAFTDYDFAVAYYAGVLLVREGLATPYTVFQVIEALHMASMLIIAASNYFPEYLKARLSAGVMFDMIFNEPPKIDSISESGTKPEIQGEIELKSVKFGYPNGARQLALNDLNIKVEKGQTVALVGSSGCGKSSTIQLIERIYDPFCGDITVDGNNIKQMNLQHLRSHIAIVNQEPILFNVSIRDNIAYALPTVSQNEIEAAAKFAAAHDFIQSLPKKYDTIVGGKGTQLSGGQKQRIAVARAIIRKPKILILDEATSALDTENEKIVQKALDEAKYGKTCLIIAHRLSTIKNADKIIVIKDGTVIESGTHAELLKKEGLYSKFVSKQNFH